MTNNKWLSCKAMLVGLAAASISAVCLAQTPKIVYDNTTTNYSGQIYYTTNEFGDQVTFATNLTERAITTVKFEYYLRTNASGNETLQLRLYRNDAAGGAPGWLLYDTGPFSISSGTSGYNYVTLDGLGLNVQEGLTWSVLFGGVESGETAGLLVYGAPTVGSSFSDFWERSGGIWGTKVIPSVVANFGAQILAIPEPGTVQLLLLGGLAGAGILWRRRSS
jgi:hypothetical protein